MTTSEYNLIVEQNADRLYRYVLKNLRDSDRSRDIVQDSFERLWINAQKIEFEKGKSYLFSIAHNTLVDSIRRSKKVSFVDSSKVPDQHCTKHYSDLKEILDEAVQRLPDVQQSVLLLRDYEGYSYKEIADITGLNEGQVKVYIFRARVYLKNYIVKMDVVI